LQQISAAMPCVKDPLNLTFSGVKAGTYLPGNTRPDGVHYDVHGNLWVGVRVLVVCSKSTPAV
jgi:hypothetical protein